MRPIDGDNLIERIEFETRHYVVRDEFDKGRIAGWNNIIKAVRDYVPTLDAVHVVRCRDCKHFSVRSSALGVYQCAIHGDYPSGEYFCADGERREEEE